MDRFKNGYKTYLRHIAKQQYNKVPSSGPSYCKVHLAPLGRCVFIGTVISQVPNKICIVIRIIF